MKFRRYLERERTNYLHFTFSRVELSSSVELLAVCSGVCCGVNDEASSRFRFEVLLFLVKLIVDVLVKLNPSMKSVLVVRFDKLRE